MVDFVFLVTDKTSIKAAWVLEFVVKKEFSAILPYLDRLAFNMQYIKFGGAVRSMAKILQLITLKNDKAPFLSQTQEKKFVAIAFDWLIGLHKVAIKAYSIQILLLLGKKEKWIHPVLKSILIENMNNYSSAYKARAKITLAIIEKHKKK